MLRSIAVAVLASMLLVACSARSGDTTPGPVAGPDGGDGDGDGGSGGLDAADAGGDGGDGATGPVLVTEPEQGMTPIYDFMRSAKKTLDMTMYELADTTATGILTQAAKSGVTVRVILDQNLEMSANATAFAALGAANVAVHWANPIYAATHQKTITVDGTTSAIMTLNFSASDYPTSRDFAVITSDPANVKAIESVFGEDFGDAGVSTYNADGLVWSPTNARSALVGIIGGATSTLLVENEEMSDTTIVSALAGAASKGVDVKIVMESSRSYTAEFTTLANATAKVVTYGHSAPLYIHAKVILADYGKSSAKVFLGSENFSYASLTENRELGLITTDPAILASINTTLSSDYAGGTPFAVPEAGAPQDAQPSD